MFHLKHVQYRLLAGNIRVLNLRSLLVTLSMYTKRVNAGRERTFTFNCSFFCLRCYTIHNALCLHYYVFKCFYHLLRLVIVVAARLPKFSFSPTFDLQFGTQVYIIWAMHGTSDASSSGSLSPRHTVRAISSMKYNLIEKALAAKPLGKKGMVNY